MSQRPNTVRFVDANPFPASKRQQELIRAEARSHAASVSHPKYRKAPAVQHIEQINNIPSKFEAAEQPPAQDPKQHSPPKHYVHRYRLSGSPPSTAHSRANIGRRRHDGKQDNSQKLDIYHQVSIPLYKGNSDPFTSTVIPVSALEHSLLQAARAQSMMNTWPSEMKIRRNHSSVTSESMKRMPLFIADKAVGHALLAHAYYSSGARQRTSGQFFEHSLAVAEKHKFQGLRSLQESLEEQRKTGDGLKLYRIFEACCWLAAAEMLSGNIHAAMVHLSASRKIIDQMGGWTKVDRMAQEILLGAVVMLGAGLRIRPVMDMGNFDPGPWSATDWQRELRDTPELLKDVKQCFPLNHSALPHSTSMTLELRAMFEDFRELLTVEELRLKYANVKTPATTKLFRWSHARKVCVRSRTLHYWCDLNETAKRDGMPQIVIQVPVRAGVVLPSQLTLSMEFALCAAMRCFDRCVFEEHYQPAGVYREAKRYHLELVSIMTNMRPATLDFQANSIPLSEPTDEFSYDILWIYAVGAYVEDVFIRPELHVKGELDTSQTNKFFGTRFSYLVATNLVFATFDDVRQLLENGYLYYPRLMDTSLKKLVML